MERQIITLTTDWGSFNCFVGMAKGTLYSAIPNITVVDINHNIPLNDISQGAFIAKHACPTFPDGTIHIIDVNDNCRHDYIAVKYRNQYYICIDNGLPHLLFNNEYSEAVVLPTENDEANGSQSNNAHTNTFNALAYMIPAAQKLAETKSLTEIGTPISQLNVREQKGAITPEASKLFVYVIHIDNHGNAYLNISYEEFLEKKQDRKFKLSVHEWSTDTIYYSFLEKTRYNNLLLVSSTGNLMLAHRSGSFAELMNVSIDSKLEITFS